MIRVWRKRGDGPPPPPLPRSTTTSEAGFCSVRGRRPRDGYVAAQSAPAATSARAAESALAATAARSAESPMATATFAHAAMPIVATVSDLGSGEDRHAEVLRCSENRRSRCRLSGVQFDPGGSVSTPCPLLPPPSHRTTSAVAMNGLVWNCP